MGSTSGMLIIKRYTSQLRNPSIQSVIDSHICFVLQAMSKPREIKGSKTRQENQKMSMEIVFQ